MPALSEKNKWSQKWQWGQQNPDVLSELSQDSELLRRAILLGAGGTGKNGRITDRKHPVID